MPFTRYRRTFEPEELALLQKVFDRVSKQRGISSKDTQKANKLAAELVLIFSQGVRTEPALLQGLAPCDDRPPMLVTIKCVGDDLFSVDWAAGPDAITIRVPVPRSEGMRIYGDAEREGIACKKAQDMALNFAESLIGEKCVSVPAEEMTDA